MRTLFGEKCPYSEKSASRSEQIPSFIYATLRFFGPSAKGVTGPLQLFAVISSLADLPAAKPDLESHANKASNTNTTRIAHSGCPQRKLAVLFGQSIRDLSK